MNEKLSSYIKVGTEVSHEPSCLRVLRSWGQERIDRLEDMPAWSAEQLLVRSDVLHGNEWQLE